MDAESQTRGQCQGQTQAEGAAQTPLDALRSRVCVLDERGRILRVNDAWREFAGECATRSKLVGVGADYLAVCDHAEGPEAADARAFAAGIRAVIRGERKEFSHEYACHGPQGRGWYIGRVSRYFEQGACRLVVAHEDITQRKEAEDATREGEKELAAIYEQAPFVLLVVDEAYRVQKMNRLALEFMRGTVAGAFGLRFGEALGCAEVANCANSCGGSACEGCQLRRLVSESFRSGISCREVEVKLCCRRGEEIQSLVLLVSTSRISEGPQPRVLMALQDISASRQLEAQLRHSQRLEAAGQLAGGIAHDFNNILAATLMYLGLVQSDPGFTPAMKASLQELQGEVHRGARLIRQLLLFSRQQMPRAKPLDLAQLLADMLQSLRPMVGEGVELVLDSGSQPAWIQADGALIGQLVVHLALNARDAMPRGGRLVLGLRRVRFEVPLEGKYTKARPGEFICFSALDTGCGMEPKVLERLFEPFFTTKKVGQGIGLGLATVHGIVRQHQGWIEVESQVGHGSKFTVFLPALKVESQTDPARSIGGRAAIALALPSLL